MINNSLIKVQEKEYTSPSQHRRRCIHQRMKPYLQAYGLSPELFQIRGKSVVVKNTNSNNNQSYLNRSIMSVRSSIKKPNQKNQIYIPQNDSFYLTNHIDLPISNKYANLFQEIKNAENKQQYQYRKRVERLNIQEEVDQIQTQNISRKYELMLKNIAKLEKVQQAKIQELQTLQSQINEVGLVEINSSNVIQQNYINSAKVTQQNQINSANIIQQDQIRNVEINSANVIEQRNLHKPTLRQKKDKAASLIQAHVKGRIQLKRYILYKKRKEEKVKKVILIQQWWKLQMKHLMIEKQFQISHKFKQVRLINGHTLLIITNYSYILQRIRLQCIERKGIIKGDYRFYLNLQNFQNVLNENVSKESLEFVSLLNIIINHLIKIIQIQNDNLMFDSQNQNIIEIPHLMLQVYLEVNFMNANQYSLLIHNQKGLIEVQQDFEDVQIVTLQRVIVENQDQQIYMNSQSTEKEQILYQINKEQFSLDNLNQNQINQNITNQDSDIKSEQQQIIIQNPQSNQILNQEQFQQNCNKDQVQNNDNKLIYQQDQQLNNNEQEMSSSSQQINIYNQPNQEAIQMNKEDIKQNQQEDENLNQQSSKSSQQDQQMINQDTFKNNEVDDSNVEYQIDIQVNKIDEQQIQEENQQEQIFKSEYICQLNSNIESQKKQNESYQQSIKKKENDQNQLLQPQQIDFFMLKTCLSNVFEITYPKIETTDHVNSEESLNKTNIIVQMGQQGRLENDCLFGQGDSKKDIAGLPQPVNLRKNQEQLFETQSNLKRIPSDFSGTFKFQFSQEIKGFGSGQQIQQQFDIKLQQQDSLEYSIVGSFDLEPIFITTIKVDDTDIDVFQIKNILRLKDQDDKYQSFDFKITKIQQTNCEYIIQNLYVYIIKNCINCIDSNQIIKIQRYLKRLRFVSSCVLNFNKELTLICLFKSFFTIKLSMYGQIQFEEDIIIDNMTIKQRKILEINFYSICPLLLFTKIEFEQTILESIKALDF